MRQTVSVTVDEARAFVTRNHRAVLITRRRSGGLQTSPITVGVDGDDKLVISSLTTTYKVRNLRRDPAATLCIFSDQWFGVPWMHIDGIAEIISLPEAMDGLIDYYRGISGEHPDWDDYRRAMIRDKRVLIRISIEHVGPRDFG
jgi:PPOX class probable F420-dependent enzyme